MKKQNQVQTTLWAIAALNFVKHEQKDKVIEKLLDITFMDCLNSTTNLIYLGCGGATYDEVKEIVLKVIEREEPELYKKLISKLAN